MKYLQLIYIFLLIGCFQNQNGNNRNSVQLENFKISDLFKKIEFRAIPTIDSTNFDNFNKNEFFNKSVLKQLQIKKIYPDIDSEKIGIKVGASYKINLSDNFYSIVIFALVGEHEIESTLINYSLDYKLIDHIKISYDEIAEGAFRKECRIEKNKLKISNITWFDKKEEEILHYEITKTGKIKIVANKK